MSARECRPDLLIVGAPKAGTSALHAALAQHPQIYASLVKEPKYFMSWDAPRRLAAARRCAKWCGVDLAT